MVDSNIRGRMASHTMLKVLRTHIKSTDLESGPWWIPPPSDTLQGIQFSSSSGTITLTITFDTSAFATPKGGGRGPPPPPRCPQPHLRRSQLRHQQRRHHPRQRLCCAVARFTAPPPTALQSRCSQPSRPRASTVHTVTAAHHAVQSRCSQLRCSRLRRLSRPPVLHPTCLLVLLVCRRRRLERVLPRQGTLHCIRQVGQLERTHSDLLHLVPPPNAVGVAHAARRSCSLLRHPSRARQLKLDSGPHAGGSHTWWTCDWDRDFGSGPRRRGFG